MTVFLTPDGQPFYGGTYYPKPTLLSLMGSIDDVWRNRQADVHQNTAALMQALARSAAMEPVVDVPAVEVVNAALQQLGQSFDGEWGGFGPAPKFPSTMNLELVLRAHVQQPSDAARTVITTTLDAMASGGIYDHLGGGFARYSVDQHWLVPHFEKMLYDQALLLRTYVHAWLVFREPRWQQVVEETIGYVLREMTDADGGWYSAEDADSPDEHGHGHEGLFYTWTMPELVEVLGPELAARAAQWWEVTDDGNFEGRNILCRLNHRGDLIRPPDIDRARRMLFEARATRRRPGLDNKVLAEWNALFLGALAEAGSAFGRNDWLAAATANAEFLVREMRDGRGRWFRSWQGDGTPRLRHAALAADHACLVDTFVRLAEAIGDGRWIAEATDVADTLLDHFWDTEQGGVFTTADDAEALIVRQKDLLDNATPSANSMTAVALYRLGALTGEPRFTNHADQTLRLLGRVLTQAPTAAGNALAAVEMRRHGLAEVLVTGDRPDLVAVVHAEWRPNAVLAWGEPFDSPLWQERPDGLAFVCENSVCQLPVSTPEALAEQLSNR
jgi:uncharacterized protein YyaL (SSP411 family)